MIVGRGGNDQFKARLAGAAPLRAIPVARQSEAVVDVAKSSAVTSTSRPSCQA